MALTETEAEFSEIIADVVERWGFKRQLGRVWSLLYLRPKPLNPHEIQEELSLSAGSVNSLLAELQTWGVIKRIRIPEDRSFYFETQPSIWKSVSNVARARELRLLEEALSGLKSLSERLKSQGDREMASFQLARVEHVRESMETAFALATLLINTPPQRLPSVARLVTRLRRL